MPRKKRTEKPIRYRAARDDGTLGALAKNIAKKFNVPAGCLVFKRPGASGRRMRSDATVAALRDLWAKK